MEPPAVRGERYFVTFIDEASGRLAISFLYSKGDVFENFITYRQRAEKETGKEIKSFRTDGRGEYMNNKFHTYLREAGIVKITTPPYTPAQNGLAERTNRTLTEAARCMLLDAGLGNQFWGFAILAAAHIINRMPSRVHAGKSSFEIWTGTKPGIGHLRIFGFPTHVLILAENRRKIDFKSAQCIFIGYAEKQGTRVYNLYQPNTGKTIISRDVVFDEADNQKHHISEPATNQEVDTVMTPFDEDSNTRRRSISDHTLNSRETSHPPEHMVARGPQQPTTPPTGELLDSDTDMEDFSILS